LIWRIQDRHTFVDLRRSGLRVKASTFQVSFVPDLGAIGSPPRLAFSVPRKVGNAVERNLIRRRLRSVFRGLVADPTVEIGSGAYLVSVRTGALTSTYEELTMELREGLERLAHLVARRSGRPSDG
jgi:ribonuclease P protein component